MQRFDVFLVDVSLQQVFSTAELVKHACAVHHGDDVVELDLYATSLLLLAEVVDGKGDGNGLANARGLDDDVVELA